MRLYIIRHAETEHNKLGLIQGSEVDSNLNEIGKQQSDLFFDFYKGINFEKIYTSGLKRTFQTVQRFIDIGIPFEKFDEFNEISWGVNQGQNDDLKEYKELTESWKNGYLDNKFDMGESPNEMVIRLMMGFERIIKENFSKVLICIHGRALRIILSKLIDNDLRKMDKYNHSNTGLYILNYNKEIFSLKLSNDRTHIK
tara:strand:- start:1212 stop:1805 length:594 start_codon:yes stop_codon:yes gene_type:complete